MRCYVLDANALLIYSRRKSLTLPLKRLTQEADMQRASIDLPRTLRPIVLVWLLVAFFARALEPQTEPPSKTTRKALFCRPRRRPA